MEGPPRGPGIPGPKPPERKRIYRSHAIGCGAVALAGIILVLALRALFPTPGPDQNIWIHNSASVPVNVRVTYEGNIVDAVRSMGYDGEDLSIEPGKAVRFHPPYMGKFTFAMKQAGDLPAATCSVALHDRREFAALVDLAGRGRFVLQAAPVFPSDFTEEDKARFRERNKDLLAGHPRTLSGKQSYIFSHNVHYGIGEPLPGEMRAREPGGEVRWKLGTAMEFAPDAAKSPNGAKSP